MQNNKPATHKKTARQEAADFWHLPGGAAISWHTDHHISISLLALGMLGSLLLPLLVALGVLPVGLDCRGHNLPLILLCLLGCLQRPLLSMLSCPYHRARLFAATMIPTTKFAEGAPIRDLCILH